MAQKNQNSKPDPFGNEMLLLIIFSIVLVVIVWMTFRGQISRFILHYDYALTWVPSWVSGKAGLSETWFQNLIAQIALLSWTPRQVEPGTLFLMTQKSSLILVPLVIFPVRWAISANKSPFKTLNRLYEHWDLMKVQSKTNPCIVPVVRFTEYWSKHKIERHPNLFRALNPDEFAEKHGLISITPVAREVDFVKTNALFEAQIGPVLDVRKLPEYKKALAAIFMTRIVYRGQEGRDRARKMLDTISNSCNPAASYKINPPDFCAAFDFSCAKDFDSLIEHEKIKTIRTYFVHEKTFFMRLLAEAREDGKLPPPDFIWLKLIDRDFWYALYAVSRTLIAKGYTEGGGPMGQYWSAITAMQNDQVLFRPYTEETIRAFERRLFEANMVSERKMMTDKERRRAEEFGRIPEI